MSAIEAPLPPMVRMRRVGHGYDVSDEQVVADYLRVGADIHRMVVSLLPEDWSPAGKRILDFGAGAGRALRHFGRELEGGAELWGCDIDGASIDWARENLPQCTFFRNDEAPPLDAPDEHFDVVFAMSVFTHITRHWADWLLELHRVMRPGGILIASFLGHSMHETLRGEPLDEERVGMLTLRPGASWDEEGGPIVFHSRWWLGRHWSPAFDLTRIDDGALEHGGRQGHGIVVGRRRDDRPPREALLEPAAEEPREARAALHNVELLCRELEDLRSAVAAGGSTAVDADALAQALRRERALHDEAGRLQERMRDAATSYESTISHLRGELAATQAELDRQRALLNALHRSPSWRMTAPLRRAKRLLGR